MGILPAGGRPYFFNGVVMGKEKLEILWKKLVNRETVSYLIFGVLTTLVDWLVYPILRWLDYSVAVSSAGSWAAAVLFAFVTNKLFVFQSYTFRPRALAQMCIRDSFGTAPVRLCLWTGGSGVSGGKCGEILPRGPAPERKTAGQPVICGSHRRGKDGDCQNPGEGAGNLSSPV